MANADLNAGAQNVMLAYFKEWIWELLLALEKK